MNWKRLTALLLLLTLLTGLVPGVRGAEERGISPQTYGRLESLWQKLEEPVTGPAALSGPLPAQSAAALVEEHPLYLENSLRWQGEDSFTFETTLGVTCGYSGRLKESLRNRKTPLELTRPTLPDKPPVPGEISVIGPYYGKDGNFGPEYPERAEALALLTGGTCRVYSGAEATVDTVARALEESSLVIFDSHGETDYYTDGNATAGAMTSYLLLDSGVGLTSEDFAYDREADTYHAVYYGRDGDMYFYGVDGTCIANHMQEDNAGGLLWMALCYGMATDGLCGPLMARGVDTVCGYSQSVTFEYDYKWESSFFDHLGKGATVCAASAVMKERVGLWDQYDRYPQLEKALEKEMAFPVMASREDPYPGRGHVDGLQEVRSLWTLPRENPHVLRTTVSDETMGSLRREGNQVWAEPCPGYRFSSWALVPENGATVRAEGNTIGCYGLIFDSTLLVRFEPREEATLTFIVPQGVRKSPQTLRVGERAELSPPEGEPLARGENYVFAGWAQSPVEDSPHCALLLSPYEITRTEETLYGVYSYEKAGVTLYTTALREKERPSFEDVGPDQWFYEDVTAMAEAGILEGVGENRFAPQSIVTRGMLVTVLHRLSGEPAPETCLFEDVSPEDWYRDGAAWAQAAGITAGVTPQRFSPEAPVTREQTGTMLRRFEAHMGRTVFPEGELGLFADGGRVSAYAVPAMAWAVEEGLFRGIPRQGGLWLCPGDTATRAQISALLRRFTQAPEA